MPKMVPELPKRAETKNGVSLKALKYEISDNLLKMSKAKPIFEPELEDDEIVIVPRDLTTYGVCVNALTYMPTDNMVKIARPREIPEPKNPPEIYEEKKRTKYNIVEEALKYKPTDRILKLSKPIFRNKRR